MCDRLTPLDHGALALSRRRFAVLGLATTLAACARPMADGGEAGLSERKVSISTPDGKMDALFVHPRGTASGAVIMWPDIAGRRAAFDAMARRLAATGRAVLVANPYYRSVPAPQFADFAEFRENDGFAKVKPWRDQFSPEGIRSDTNALVDWLDAQDAVDTDVGIGIQGYCMTGSFTVRGAAARPDRVRLGASFHGGGLVGDEASSPHRQLGESRATHMFAIAQNDDAESPGDKTALREAAKAAGRPAEIEVYPADHGWTVLDSPSYDEAAAERALGRLMALYDAM